MKPNNAPGDPKANNEIDDGTVKTSMENPKNNPNFGPCMMVARK